MGAEAARGTGGRWGWNGGWRRPWRPGVLGAELRVRRGGPRRRPPASHPLPLRHIRGRCAANTSRLLRGDAFCGQAGLRQDEMTRDGVRLTASRGHCPLAHATGVPAEAGGRVGVSRSGERWAGSGCLRSEMTLCSAVAPDKDSVHTKKKDVKTRHSLLPRGEFRRGSVCYAAPR